MTTSTSARSVQDTFERAVRRFMAERSTVIETTLFDLPRKMILYNQCAVEVLPGVVAEIERRVPATELGRRRRVVGLPLALDLGGLPWMYLFGRLQRYLDAGWPDTPVDLDDH